MRKIIVLFFCIQVSVSCSNRFLYNDAKVYLDNSVYTHQTFFRLMNNYLELHNQSLDQFIYSKTKIDTNLNIRLYEYETKKGRRALYFQTSNNTISVTQNYREIQYSISKKNSKKELPNLYQSYNLNYLIPPSMGLIRLSKEDSILYLSDTVPIVDSKYFPDKLKLIDSSYLYIYRKFIFNNCFKPIRENTFHAPPLVSDLMIFNPSSNLYTSSIIDMWNKDYKAFIYCLILKSIQPNPKGGQNENFISEQYIENIEGVSQAINMDDKELSKFIDKQYLKYIESNYNTEGSAMHKSYFQLILWHLYRPVNFIKIESNGDFKTFKFTSNNPEYPGNYEVKFNIYEPYRFKVVKR